MQRVQQLNTVKSACRWSKVHRGTDYSSVYMKAIYAPKPLQRYQEVDLKRKSRCDAATVNMGIRSFAHKKDGIRTRWFARIAALALSPIFTPNPAAS